MTQGLYAYLHSFDDQPDDELTEYDFRGDTEPLQPISELVCPWCERAVLDCDCVDARDTDNGGV